MLLRGLLGGKKQRCVHTKGPLLVSHPGHVQGKGASRDSLFSACCRPTSFFPTARPTGPRDPSLLYLLSVPLLSHVLHRGTLPLNVICCCAPSTQDSV